MEEDGKHKHKQPRGSSSSGAASGSSWKLDPAIERRLSGQSSFSFAEGTPETRNNNDDDDDVAVVAASSTPSPIFGLSRTTGLALPSYDMYSNIPELNSDNARRQESFSSLPVPNLGSQPHSRRQTPADAGWMETLDLTRLFFGLGKPRGQLDGFDESLTPLQTPEKGRRSKRSTPGSKHGQGGANLSSRLLEDEDEDSDHSFRETIEGIDGGKGSEPTDHSLAFDAHIRSRSGSWLSRLWNKHFDSRNYYNSEFRARDYESDYLALVPLSDPRLSKRWPLWVFVLLVVLFSASVFCGVFFFVQRQVAVNQGEIVTKTSSIHVNPLKPGGKSLVISFLALLLPDITWHAFVRSSSIRLSRLVHVGPRDRHSRAQPKLLSGQGVWR